jgi:hypothetical protein
MKRKIYILLLVLVATAGSASAQENLLKNPQVRKCITKWFSFGDPNPTHQAEADSVNVLLRDILAAWEHTPQVPDSRLKTRALELFYANSRIGDEDGTDGYRMFVRRNMCYIALALLPGSEYRWYSAFIEDARDWVGDGALPQDVPERELAMIDMVEALLLTNSAGESHKKRTVEKLRDNVALLSKMDPSSGVQEWFVAEYTTLTNLVVKALE